MTSPDWHAPAASGRLDATVTLPGSKSLTNRYLVLAALAVGLGAAAAWWVSRPLGPPRPLLAALRYGRGPRPAVEAHDEPVA